MKIKTIAHGIPEEFDVQVNYALGMGFSLTRRERVETPPGSKDYFYAELVMPDDEEHHDPLDHVRAIQDFCHSVSFEECHDNKCPLHNWCDRLKRGEDPTGWELPEEELQA